MKISFETTRYRTVTRMIIKGDYLHIVNSDGFFVCSPNVKLEEMKEYTDAPIGDTKRHLCGFCILKAKYPFIMMFSDGEIAKEQKPLDLF